MANYRFELAGSTPELAADSGSTLTQQVYETLHDEIVSGALHPGDRLVRRTLSKRLGVSPMPVTEALLRLEVDGLVESRPLYGSRVRPLTIKDVENDQVLREAVECQAARVCAENASDAELAKLMRKAQVVDRMMDQGDPGSKLGTRTHQEFHTAVAHAGGFPGLADELARVWFRRLMRLNWVKATHYKRVPDRWHQSLVEAISSRDPEVAERKMREHVRYGNEDNRKALQFLLNQSDQEE